jgi:NDP-sugar pyrophosphorylase family protein
MPSVNMQDVHVVILAGGKGTRLRPYATAFPKPLMPVGDLPVLEIVLRQLHYFGFRKITLSVNHLAELIRLFCGDGAKWGLDLHYCVENQPLGTAGSVGLVEDLTDPFLVMNGDLLTTLDYGALVAAHVQSGVCATMGVFPREVRIDFGVVALDERGHLAEYKEKPRLEYLVSMGVNAFSRAALDFIPKGQYLDIPTLMMNLKNAGRSVAAFRSPCEWLDIGRPDDYERATECFEAARSRYLRATPP